VTWQAAERANTLKLMPWNAHRNASAATAALAAADKANDGKRGEV
jgi:hypothetical protein